MESPRIAARSSSPGPLRWSGKGELQDGARSGGKTIRQEKIMIIHICFNRLLARILQAMGQDQFRPAFQQAYAFDIVIGISRVIQPVGIRP